MQLPPPPGYYAGVAAATAAAPLAGAPVAGVPPVGGLPIGMPSPHFSFPMPGMPGAMPGMMPGMVPGMPGMPGGMPGMPMGGMPRPFGYPVGPPGALGPAPTYVPTMPFPSEAELAARPPPTTNCDPFDETWPTFNVFVGDLTPDFTDADLYAAYQPAGPIHSVSVVRDKMSGAAKFGFTNFLTQAAKDYALDQMKTTVVRGVPIRCFVSDSKSALLVNGVPAWEPAAVKAELERIGGSMLGEPIMQQPGLWLCNYINYRRAEKALSLLNGKACGPNKVPMTASLAVGKQSGTASMPPKGSAMMPGGKPPATLFIKNISTSIDEAALAKYFGKHGTVTRSTIVREHGTNESKGFGFVELATDEDAQKALTGTNMTILDSKMLSVEFAVVKIPDAAGGAPGGAPRPLGVGAGGIPMIMPAKAPMVQRREPKSRHQNDGDGGFNAPRGFADAATEQRGGLTIFDDGWTTANVPVASAIAGTNGPPEAGPIMRDGKMVGWGIPTDDRFVGTAAPQQGAPESRCRAQRLLAQQMAPQGPPQLFPVGAPFLNFAGPILPTQAAATGFGGGSGGFGGPPSFGGRGGGPPGGGFRGY